MTGKGMRISIEEAFNGTMGITQRVFRLQRWVWEKEATAGKPMPCVKKSLMDFIAGYGVILTQKPI